MANQVQRKTACVDDLGIHAYREARTGRLRITGVTIDGQLCVPTLSFWRSMFREVGLASCVGPRFDEYTWFSRLRRANPFLVFRYVLAEDRHGNAMLLGEPTKQSSETSGASTNLDTGGAKPADVEFDEIVAERLSHHWQNVEVVNIPLGLVDSPAGHVKPSLN